MAILRLVPSPDLLNVCYYSDLSDEKPKPDSSQPTADVHGIGHRIKAGLDARYEERVLAFIDVLGWSEFIRRSIRDESLMMELRKTTSLIEGEGSA